MLIATTFHNNQVTNQTPWVTQLNVNEWSPKRAVTFPKQFVFGSFKSPEELFPIISGSPQEPCNFCILPQRKAQSQIPQNNTRSASHFQNLLTLLYNRNKIKASERTIRLLFRAQGRTGSAGGLEKIRTPDPRWVFITCLSTWHLAEPNFKDKCYWSGRADKGKHISKIAQKVSLASLFFWFRRRLLSRLRNKSYRFPVLARRDSAAKSWAPDFKPLTLLPGCLKILNALFWTFHWVLCHSKLHNPCPPKR